MNKKKDEQLLNGEVIVENKKEKTKKENKTESLEERITVLEEELAIATNEYYKAYADAENIKKRLRHDFDMHNKYRLQSFASEILPALDNFERALETADHDSTLYQGIVMIYNQLLEALKKEGVEEIVALDQPFDPNFHQSMLAEKVEGKDAGMVIEVLQKGYKIKDRVLRASLVKISE
jgi:Molecular chaperone GrpE (heat shock protein)